MKEKSEVFKFFKQYVQRVEVEMGHAVNTIRSDNGGELIGGDFEDWMKQKGIRHETSAPYTPQQNGVSERKNRTVVEAAQTMLSLTSLPPAH